MHDVTTPYHDVGQGLKRGATRPTQAPVPCTLRWLRCFDVMDTSVIAVARALQLALLAVSGLSLGRVVGLGVACSWGGGLLLQMARLARNEAYDVQLKLLLIGDSGTYLQHLPVYLPRVRCGLAGVEAWNVAGIRRGKSRR